MIIVADSSPLISFAIIEKLNILPKIFPEIFIPEAVFNELNIWNKPYLKILIDFSKSRIKKVENRLAVDILCSDLDLGEAEAVILALENNIKNILMDEYKGRKIAASKGLFPIGTLGVLIQAKKAGLVNHIKPLLDNLIENKIRISKQLYFEALYLTGERKSK